MIKRMFCTMSLFVIGLSVLSAQAKSVTTQTVPIKTTVVDSAKSGIKAPFPSVTTKSATTVKTTPSVKMTSKTALVAKKTTKSKTTVKKTATKTTAKTAVKPTVKTTTSKTTTVIAIKPKSVPTNYAVVKKPTVQVTSKGAELTPKSDMPLSFNNQMLAEVNALRKSGTTCGDEKMPPVKALAWNTKLEKAAIVHVVDMDTNDHFGHEGTDGSMPDDRFTKAGYEWERIGENIGQGYKDVSHAMKGWKESANHCKQMMSAEITEIGAAKKGKYWCQTFAKPMN